jgi:flagellar protein FlgJ
VSAVASVADFAQFAELRRGADGNDPEALRAVAGQFEALFVQSMLKSMRDASIGDPIFGDNDGFGMYQEMLDKQLAVEMSTAKGIGLADMLVRQLGGGDSARGDDRLPPRDFPLTRPPERSGYPLLNDDAPMAFPLSNDEFQGDFALPHRPENGNRPQSANWRSPEDFARDVWPHVQRVAKRLNVPAEGLLAQAALETGWGRHVMPAKDGSNSHNLFGIKAAGGWAGDSTLRKTIEFEGGIAQHRQAKFRAYPDVGASFDDYLGLMSGNPRYAAVQGHGRDVAAFAGALAASGYATDPAYAEKISRVAGSSTMKQILAQLKNAADAPIDP